MAHFHHVVCDKYLTVIITDILKYQNGTNIIVLRAKRETNTYKPFAQSSSYD